MSLMSSDSSQGFLARQASGGFLTRQPSSSRGASRFTFAVAREDSNAHETATGSDTVTKMKSNKPVVLNKRRRSSAEEEAKRPSLFKRMFAAQNEGAMTQVVKIGFSPFLRVSISA